jgi:hypothetical protein
LRKEEDLSKRRSLRIFHLLFLAGLILFDISVRIPYPAGLSGIDDYVIAACQILAPGPSLIYLSNFLRRHALGRPFQKPRLDLKIVPAPFGVSARETEIL